MDDELTTEHLDVGIPLSSRLVGLTVARAVEGIAGTVAANEPFATSDSFEQCFLAFLGHGWCVVSPFFDRQIACGVKEEGIVLGNFFRHKDASILGAVDIEAMLLAPFGDEVFSMGQLALLAEELLAVRLAAIDDIVLKILRTGKEQELLIRLPFGCGVAERERRSHRCQSSSLEKIASLHERKIPVGVMDAL